MLLDAAKYHGYNFYHFWVIETKPTGRGGGGRLKLTPPPSNQIRVKAEATAEIIGPNRIRLPLGVFFSKL